MKQHDDILAELTDVLSSVEKALPAFEVPGLAIAAVRNDELLVATGFGMRALGAAVPVDAGTLFAIGSITKSFTALALAMLVDDGRLAWDDRVVDHLPGFRLADAWVTREITVRDLLIHRSGLRNVSGGAIWYGSDYDRTAVIQRLRYIQPVSSFRSRYAYQNVTYLVAGELIPALTGMSWDAFVAERIFGPLRMQASLTSVEALEPDGNVVTPHARIGGHVRAVAHRNYDNVAPAASIYSNVRDMAHYTRLYLNGGLVDGRRLLGEASARELFAPQTPIPITPLPAPLNALTPNFLVYGLGWVIRDYYGRRLVYHSGGVDGMTSLLCMLPDEGIGVVVLTNQQEGIVGPAAYGVIDALLALPPIDRIGPALQARAAQHAREQAAAAARDAARIPGTMPSLALEGYAGDYDDPAYGTVGVALDADGLVLRFSRTPSFVARLEHWHHDTFRAAWADPMVPQGFVSFVLDASARVRELRLDQPKLLDVDFDELLLTHRPRQDVEGH
jgi:CubicO group peptidase (beta-lactamase class C family)